jgi:hypothetical protein
MRGNLTLSWRTFDFDRATMCLSFQRPRAKPSPASPDSRECAYRIDKTAQTSWTGRSQRFRTAGDEPRQDSRQELSYRRERKLTSRHLESSGGRGSPAII